MTDGGETDGGETDGGETDGGETDGGETDGGETDATAGNSIVDIAVADGRFTTLVTALEALGSSRPSRAKAPSRCSLQTDEAFGGLRPFLDAALGDLELLGTVLNLHVLSTEVFAADIAAGESFVETLGGTKVLVVNGDEGVTVGGGRSVRPTSTQTTASSTSWPTSSCPARRSRTSRRTPRATSSARLPPR